MDDGTEQVMGPGDFFYVPPGHDSWVVARPDEAVNVHFAALEGGQMDVHRFLAARVPTQPLLAKPVTTPRNHTAMGDMDAA